WHSPLTIVNYILLGSASGFLLAACFASLAAPNLTRFFAGWTIIITFLGLLGRIASLIRNRRLRQPSTIQTAIGVKHPKIVQKSQGFMGGSFNTREFFHGRSATFLKLIRPFFLVLTFVAPLLLLGISMSVRSSALLALTFLMQYSGLIAERWYFFADANHPQNLYYQTIG
ncbi:MAG TPA: DMSO reductase, partial [Burkholderiales bacterium]|nr:DMSO reductase [Burkholderiales bacterium]